MSNQLFNNKYYSQLFGGRQQREDGEEHQEQQNQDQDEQTEDTRDRLERIFGGKQKQQRAGARATGATHEGRAVYEFSNGALATRMPNKSGVAEAGRYKIFSGPKLASNPAAMAALRQGREHRNRTNKKGEVVVREGRITAVRAKKAFEAYWNRRMRDAKTVDAAKGLSGTRKSQVAAVKRAKTGRMTHAKPASHTLNEASPMGWAYLRRQSRKLNRSGNPTHRAGPAIYDFEGVNPARGSPRRKYSGPAKGSAAAKDAMARRLAGEKGKF